MEGRQTTRLCLLCCGSSRWKLERSKLGKKRIVSVGTTLWPVARLAARGLYSGRLILSLRSVPCSGLRLYATHSQWPLLGLITNRLITDSPRLRSESMADARCHAARCRPGEPACLFAFPLPSSSVFKRGWRDLHKSLPAAWPLPLRTKRSQKTWQKGDLNSGARRLSLCSRLLILP